MTSPAIFLDRDGTIIENRHYISDPDDIVLLPGASEAIRVLAKAGFKIVLVTNQSGIARGYFTEEQLANIHVRLKQVLAEHGASLDAIYYSPFLDGPEATVEVYRKSSEMRKPAPGMLLLAAKELEIELPSSWMIGDSLSDIEAGRCAGCRTILIRSYAAEPTSTVHFSDFVVPSLAEAVPVILNQFVRPS